MDELKYHTCLIFVLIYLHSFSQRIIVVAAAVFSQVDGSSFSKVLHDARMSFMFY